MALLMDGQQARMHMKSLIGEKVFVSARTRWIQQRIAATNNAAKQNGHLSMPDCDATKGKFTCDCAKKAFAPSQLLSGGYLNRGGAVRAGRRAAFCC